MTKEQAYEQYNYEVSLYEQYGGTNIISFEDWLEIKGIEIKED